MTERAHAQNHRHLFLRTYLQKAAQIALAIPTEDALFLLHMIPEHIGGNHRHPTLFHLLHLLSPFISRDTAIVHLAHHWHDTMSVDNQTQPVPLHIALCPSGNACHH